MAFEFKVEPTANGALFDPIPNHLNDYEENTADEVGGQYFMDQATGQCYYQTSNGEIMLVALEEPGELDANGTEVLNLQEEPENIEESSKAESPNSFQMISTDSTNNAGNICQTVTIVPTDTGNTDVNSYVLVVQEPEQDKKEKKDIPLGIFAREGDDVNEDYDFEKDTDAYLDAALKKSKKNGDSTFPCKKCNYTTTKAFLLSRHMRSHSEVRPHRCAVCDRGFKSLPCLQNHVNTHTGTKPFKCKFCSHRFTTSGELVRHVRYKHTFEKPHKCTECDYASVELSKLKRHIRIHTGERPFECNQCTYSSPDTFKLKRHMRIHTGERPYNCDLCPAAFTQSNSLKSHRQIHTNSKPIFQCQFCQTTCGRKTDLRLHIQKQHTSVETIHCKVCGEGFADRYTLKVHKKIHNGQKCFTCELCPYASTSQRHLESHMLLHTDQKPFQCDACDQAFRQRQLLRRHQNIRHNPGYVPPKPKAKQHEVSNTIELRNWGGGSILLT